MISAVSLLGTAGRGGRRRGFRLGAALGVAIPVLLLGAFSLLGGGDTSTSTANTTGTDATNAGLSEAELAAQRDALADFEEALTPITERGAATVVYGMRPGIEDIFTGNIDDATLVTMSEGWVTAMESARDDLAAIEVPAFLSETAALYGDAFDTYLTAAESLHAAAQASGEARSAHISDAAEAGNRADDVYDTAKARLAEHQERLGLHE